MTREELIETLVRQEEKTAHVIATVKAKKEGWDKVRYDATFHFGLFYLPLCLIVSPFEPDV
jgi:hypothetical protein